MIRAAILILAGTALSLDAPAALARRPGVVKRTGIVVPKRMPDPIHGQYPRPRLPFEPLQPPPEPAPTETLADAISRAYRTNPVLGAERYQLRATDEALGQALAGLRPSTQVQVSGGYDYTDPGRKTLAERPLTDFERNDVGAQLIVDYPLYTGGRATAEIASARADIRAGREQLRGAEGDLLVQVITAYSDVRRDAQALRIRETNVRVLQATLDEVVARREAGELTRTDIAQTQTQLEAARVQLNVAQAQLEQSRASFAALVGRDPGVLAAPPTLPLLPRTIDEAFDTAERLSPDLARAVQAEKASRARIAAARAGGHPSLTLRGTAGTNGEAYPFHRYNQDEQVTARATLIVPLTAGGRQGSLVGQAADRNSADRLRIEAARRQVVQNIVILWNQMVSARRNVAVQEAQVSAAEVLNEGMYSEYRAGLRSTFDVLFAQNNLRDSQIGLSASRRDLYVSQASLLRQMGQLEASKLMTGTSLYDPTLHVKAVERRGALPWDPALRGGDRIDAANDRQQPVVQPEILPERPVMVEGMPLPDTAPLATGSRSVPIPGTAGTPARRKRP